MKVFTRIFSAVLLLGATLSCTAPAEVSLHELFSDHAVLQRGREITLEGHSEPNAKIGARWRGQSYNAVADAEGRFILNFPSGEAGGPFTLKVGSQKIKDVLVGDVYLCSGQSNVELPVRRCLDAVSEDIKGYSNEFIRYYAVPMAYSFGQRPDDISGGQWTVLESEQGILDWSALCYFTARSLYEKTGIPVGVIRSAVGGSPIEAWMGENILPDYALKQLEPLKSADYVDSLKTAASRVYSDWPARYNELPAVDTVWNDVDVFSEDWAVDSDGESYIGGHLLRKSLNLSKEEAAGDAVLHLGAIVDADSVFVNGTFVGNTSYRYPPRHYKVPSGTLHEGENLIEVHLYVYGHEGLARFVKDKKYSLETSVDDISLMDGWQHSYAKEMPARNSEIFLQYQPSGLFNAMIAPLASYKTDGVVWYQGESNTGNADLYGELLEKMITDWRSVMGEENLPFYVVELAAYEHSDLPGSDTGWNRVQRAQKATAEKMTNVHFVENADLGEWNDIHPQDKKTLGDRISNEIMKQNK